MYVPFCFNAIIIGKQSGPLLGDGAMGCPSYTLMPQVLCVVAELSPGLWGGFFFFFGGVRGYMMRLELCAFTVTRTFETVGQT